MTSVSVADYFRQQDIVRPDQLSTPILVIGAGGIGSPTVLALAKMGCSNIRVYDPDTVERHNIPNQLYRVGDVGEYKVNALQEIVRSYTGTTIYPVVAHYESQPLAEIVISAVDSMETRKRIWGTVKESLITRLYIEARMGAEVGRVYAVRLTPLDPEASRQAGQEYEKQLYSDEEAVELPCTARATIYNCFMIASLIANQVKRFAVGEPVWSELIMDLATMYLIANP